jgi:uncharacterized membrane protein YjgN (DUF898 family)
MNSAVKEEMVDERVKSIRSADVVFNGGAGDLLVTQIIAYLVTLCTFGICFPWALCMMEKWKVDHTIIDGNRLEFRGSGIGLFGKWIKWWALSVVTLGIYSFWVIPDLNKWKASNTFIVR